MMVEAKEHCYVKMSARFASSEKLNYGGDDDDDDDDDDNEEEEEDFIRSWENVRI
jgi:hypothetical protein